MDDATFLAQVREEIAKPYRKLKHDHEPVPKVLDDLRDVDTTTQDATPDPPIDRRPSDGDALVFVADDPETDTHVGHWEPGAAGGAGLILFHKSDWAEGPDPVYATDTILDNGGFPAYAGSVGDITMAAQKLTTVLDGYYDIQIHVEHPADSGGYDEYVQIHAYVTNGFSLSPQPAPRSSTQPMSMEATWRGFLPAGTDIDFTYFHLKGGAGTTRSITQALVTIFAWSAPA